MIEKNTTAPNRKPLGRRPGSAWWLVVKDGEYPKEVLMADRGGELALPVFSGEGEAELFLWLGRGPEDGWRVRETSAGELVSVLYGPYAGAGRVALDPSPGTPATGPVGPVSMSRKRFASWIAGRTVIPRLPEPTGP